jgi:hypothetical protein
MKRIKISNKRIEQIFRKKNDHYLIAKIRTIKPTINIKCPESYIFFKTQFNSYITEPKKKEQILPYVKSKKKNKTKLVIKIKNKNEKFPSNLLSNSSSHKNNNNKNTLLSQFLSKKSLLDSSKINDENYNLNKRIREKESYYSLSQWRKDFKKSRIYKKISCEYPSINFVGKPKRKITKKNQKISPIKFLNIFNDVRFIPIYSFSSDYKRNNHNTLDNDNNKKISNIRKDKFHKLFEENNKIIFDKK